MVDHLLHVVIVAAFALGFRSGVRTLFESTPLAQRKPFNCDTCLCWWGSVLGSGIVLGLTMAWRVPLGELCLWSIVYPVAATGIAKYALRSSTPMTLDSIYSSMVQQMGEPPVILDDADPDEPEHPEEAEADDETQRSDDARGSDPGFYDENGVPLGLKE